MFNENMKFIKNINIYLIFILKNEKLQKLLDF
jgi:hypothetical protein